MIRISETFKTHERVRGWFRVSERLVPVAGLAVEIVRSRDRSLIELHDGSRCTPERHVEEHERVANPVTTDSKGEIAVCVADDLYDIVISGIGFQTSVRSLDEKGKLAEKPE